MNTKNKENTPKNIPFVEEKLTKQKLEEMINSSDKSILNRFKYWTREVQHTPQYWNKVKNILCTLLINLKMPHF